MLLLSNIPYPKNRPCPRTIIRLALVLFSALLLGCASTSVTLKADFIGSIQMNPNIKGEASPTVVYIYELASPTTFEVSNYFTLTDPDSGVLGDDLLGYSEVTLFPGKAFRLTQKLHPSTRHIGFIAAFREINTAQWRAVAPVRSGASNLFTVRISKNAIDISRPESDEEISTTIKLDESVKFDF